MPTQSSSASHFDATGLSSARGQRVLLICKAWPELSQTYIRNEVRALLEFGLDVQILCTRQARVSATDAPDVPVHISDDPQLQKQIARQLAPAWIHAHYITMAPTARALAAAVGCRFSVRTHSFDVLWLRPSRRFSLDSVRSLLGTGHFAKYRVLKNAVEALKASHCAAVFCYPFARELLGPWVSPEKLHEYFPLVDLRAFSHRQSNKHSKRISVCNVGAASTKKNMDEFLRLATSCPDHDFHLYVIGYDAARLEKKGRQIPNLEIHVNVPSQHMPREYARHDWLVYTACRRLGTVGWPLAVAEAQMTGLGICLPALRPDIRDYAGPDGHLYENIGELRPVLSMRPGAQTVAAGRKLASRCDHVANVKSLRDLIMADL